MPPHFLDLALSFEPVEFEKLALKAATKALIDRHCLFKSFGMNRSKVKVRLGHGDNLRSYFAMCG